MTPTISICAIVKNEEKNIKDFIDNIKDFADEVIIVDTGSTDGTYEKIERLSRDNNKIKLFHYFPEGNFHFGKARNFAISKSMKEYVLMLDADERLSSQLKKYFRVFLKEKNPKVISVLRKDDLVSHLVEYHERALKRDANILYGTDEESRLHEHLVHNYNAEKFDSPIWHRQRDNHWLHRPQKMLFQMELEIDRTPKTKSFLGHLLRGIWAFQFKFRKVYFKQRVYKNGFPGFKYAFLRAFYAFLAQVFVGLKPKEGYKYWEDPKYKRN